MIQNINIKKVKLMELRLEKATENDAQAIFDIQVKAFMPLLNKYWDYETNPANENIERVISRINQYNGDFYKILAGNTLVGAICVFWRNDVQFWISPMFILPTHQGKGIAQKVINLIEGMFPQATTWELATILRLLKEVDAELRIGSTLRSKLTEDLASIKNRIIRWLDRYFPEFTQVFPSFGKMALAALEMTPFPQDIKGKTAEELVFLYREVEGMRTPQLPKAKLLIEASTKSIGLTEGEQMARHEIATLLRQYRLLESEIASVNSQLAEMAQTTMEYELLTSVPGLGDATIVDILSEVGSFSLYENPRQLIKLAGLTLRENSSGQHKGQKHISKRGRKKLRYILFKVMVPLIRHNKAFKQLHQYYTTRQQNPLRGKQSMVVLCGKLLKVLHGICKKKVHFNEQYMMKDLQCLGEAA